MDISQSSFRLFLSKTGNSILLFVGTIYFARELAPTQLGVFFLFQALMGLLTIPADFGMRGALEKRLSEGLDPERTLGSALAFKSVLIVFVSGGILLVQGQIDNYLGAPLTPLLVIAIAAEELSKFYIGAVRGELRVGETAPIEFMRRLIWIGLGIALVAGGFGVRGIIYGLIAGSVIAFLWAYRKCRTGIGRPSVDLTWSLFAYSKYHTVASVGGQIYVWMDLAIVGFFLAGNFVSAYQIAWQVTLLVLLVSKSIALTIFPQISQWNELAATTEIENVISKGISYSLFVSVPALIGAGIYAVEILQFIFGPEYVIASTVLIVLMVEKLFQSVNDIVEGSVRAVNRPSLAAKATVVAVTLNLILSPILVISLGFVGAALATTISWFVNTALHTFYLSRLIDLWIPYRLISWYVVLSGIMGAVLFATKMVVPVTGIAVLVLQIGLGVIVYFALAILIPDVRKQIIAPGLRTFI